MAAESGSVATLDDLLGERFLDPDSPASDGRLPLDFVTPKLNWEVVNVLVRHGASAREHVALRLLAFNGLEHKSTPMQVAALVHPKIEASCVIVSGVSPEVCGIYLPVDEFEGQPRFKNITNTDYTIQLLYGSWGLFYRGLEPPCAQLAGRQEQRTFFNFRADDKWTARNNLPRESRDDQLSVEHFSTLRALTASCGVHHLLRSLDIEVLDQYIDGKSALYCVRSQLDQAIAGQHWETVDAIISAGASVITETYLIELTVSRPHAIRALVARSGTKLRPILREPVVALFLHGAGTAGANGLYLPSFKDGRKYEALRALADVAKTRGSSW
eukprot:4493872-Prymnesium_polylepis.1